MELETLLDSRPDDTDGNRVILLLKWGQTLDARNELDNLRTRKARGNDRKFQSRAWADWCDNVLTYLNASTLK